jgi:anti-anti-sigma factor
MEFTISDHGNVKVILMTGKLDTQTSPDAERKIMDLIEAGALKIVVNFDGLDFISSAGLRVLLVTAKKLTGLGGAIRVCGMNDIVREVFEISGFDTILTVTADEAAALQGL